MSYTNGLDKPSDYFTTKLYTGDGSTQTISGVGFQPNLTWIKHRDGATAHMIFDSVRGALYRLQSNSSNTSVSAANTLTSWNSDGFALGTENDTNGSGRLFASWNWKANGAGSSNSDGSITTSVSANTTSGFSIVKWTGDGGATTLGHGLGAVPKCILVKTLDRSENWVVYHVGNDPSAPEDKSIRLDGTNAVQDNATHFNDTAPTSSVFSVGASNGVNPNGEDQIAYCFAEKQGYSKFGSYTGNGNADGTFVYTGFKVGWVMIKRTDSTNSWLILDNKRIGYNPDNNYLLADTNDADGTDNFVDLYSNGFKIMSADAAFNASGGNYIYMAFAENPFVTSTGVPATAR